MGDLCRKPDCSWLALPSLKDLKEPPELVPNPELSGVGVILGFSITAYLTVFLLLFHYLTVYNPRMIGEVARPYINPVDKGLLNFVRGKVTSWTPSRRFEYAMEKSVLILSDTQLVTGLAILIAGYSQLSCGIASYHWQILVYVAWFSSFTFLSAMAFLEGFFLANNSLRLIRVFFMCIMGTLQIAALLPTGSRNWLDAAREAGPLYVGLSAECFYQQLPMASYSRGGPRMWSMVFSVLVVGVSYIHTGIRLFDPTAKFSRKHFRAIPGSYVKSFLQFLEHRAACRGIRATIWTIPYLFAFAGYASVRAAYDIAESMLGEIIWLSFAIAWGSLKVWDTRSLVWFTQLDDGDITFKNTYNDDDTWSFGQILPMVLLLLPILSMIQSYLDNDAKAQDAVRRESNLLITHDGKPFQTVGPAAVGSGTGTDDKQISSTHDATSDGITRCNRRQPPPNTLCGNATPPDENRTAPAKESSPPDSESQTSPCLPPKAVLACVPRHPYPHLFAYHWYRDHVYLLVCQLLMIGCVILWFQGVIVSILGISYILRSRLFLIWLFGFIPLSSLVHLVAWYLAGCVVNRIDGAEEWLYGTGRYGCAGGERSRRWWRRMTRGRCVYYLLVTFLKGGLLTMTFLGSAVIAGPQNIDLGTG
ncbi:uncharacterized protein CC84DRAFT_1220884 [Paraphaeosphaeria sporulosa]|uniref:Uncharacterized protein n=1 Tax=Paraphaeosphaeria sporulosa TaxID=1460663 RepID=A0A177C3L0_9PLEO|nr:uncharacterized protein CC84DRAFT_1220884 [Paraphaeosphaeria sporulosa]OAG01367.1 hypothetical protein CC84DRAFT_1220884 [Paraphaeosphaeria sporulosa]